MRMAVGSITLSRQCFSECWMTGKDSCGLVRRRWTETIDSGQAVHALVEISQDDSLSDSQFHD
jgi:hypothetical protein